MGVNDPYAIADTNVSLADHLLKRDYVQFDYDVHNDAFVDHLNHNFTRFKLYKLV